jgi:hypothetical protein
MKTEDIIFIKTDKEGVELQEIQNDYPNSFINVCSESEKNIYIGSDRVTDNFNLIVKDDKITNNVGGMRSGIHASELKGKTISEILDIILFASNNNLILKGVQVVDKIENLTDNTLEDVYQGMVVSVLEDNSLYILLSDSDSDSDGREWKKVGTDINKEEIKEYTNTLSEPITVAGLSGSLGANISNGKTYKTIEDILKDLLCKEIYPTPSLMTFNPTINFDGINNATASNHKSLMEIGSVLYLNAVSLNEASITSGYRRGNGFDYGYSVDNDKKKDGDGNPSSISAINVSLSGNYILTETYSPESIGTPRMVEPSENYEDVKFDTGSIVVGLGENKISFKATSPSGSYTHPEYPEYYIVSNLGNTSEDKKLSKASEVTNTLNSKEDKKEIKVTGVYPVYVNISSGSFVEETIKMNLTTSDTIEFDVPSEVASGIHFTFDYPATHSVIYFKIKDLKGNFVDYAATYNVESEIVMKDINENKKNISYKRMITTGALQGEGTYKITLSKGLDR